MISAAIIGIPPPPLPQKTCSETWVRSNRAAGVGGGDFPKSKQGKLNQIFSLIQSITRISQNRNYTCIFLLLNFSFTLVWGKLLHLNTYVIHMLYYKYFNSFSAGIDFRRQNLTSTDVRF